MYTQTHTDVNTHSLLFFKVPFAYASGMGIAERLKEKMEAIEMTQYALSALSGVPQPTIGRILSGESENPRRSNLVKLAPHINTTAYFLETGNELEGLAAEFSDIYSQVNEEGRQFMRSFLAIARQNYIKAKDKKDRRK